AGAGPPGGAGGHRVIRHEQRASGHHAGNQVIWLASGTPASSGMTRGTGSDIGIAGGSTAGIGSPGYQVIWLDSGRRVIWQGSGHRVTRHDSGALSQLAPTEGTGSSCTGSSDSTAGTRVI
ncbi:unnamed protein product, partial [Staurois parvus]